jgi:hypothetical protein
MIAHMPTLPDGSPLQGSSYTILLEIGNNWKQKGNKWK